MRPEQPTNSNPTPSTRSVRASYDAGTSGAWLPGQEFSALTHYDPFDDATKAHKIAAKRKSLRYYQIFRYATALDWILMIVGMLLAIFGSIITPWLYYWAGVTLHDMVVFERCHPSRKTPNGNCSIPGYCEHSLPEVGQYLAFHVFTAWLLYIGVHITYCLFFTFTADRQIKRLRSAYFESCVRKDMSWFDLYTDRDFAKSMSEQVTQIRLGIGDAIPSLVNIICTATVMIGLVIIFNYKVALSYLLFVPLSLILVYVGNLAERKRSALADENFQGASNIAREDLVNIKMIKMYEGEQTQAQRFANALNSSHNGRKEMRWMCVAAISSGSIWLVLNIATALIFWFGRGVFQSNEEFCTCEETLNRPSFFKEHMLAINKFVDIPDGPGAMLLVYFGLMYITLNTMEVPNLITVIRTAKLNATSVFFLMEWKSRIDNLSTEGKSLKRSCVGRLDLFQVSFRYPKKPDEIALCIDVLTIFSGQFVVFAGPARSGKSTVLKLIPRLYDVCSGYITLDAVNLQNYSLRWLRSQICMLCEEPVIFTGTISENILFGKLSASQDDVVKACQQASIHHVIENLPDGYNTVIGGDDDEVLTRDHKRQICLARAYLHRCRVILLDNPLKPEDDELEPLLLKYVNAVRGTCTVIMASTNVNALTKRSDCIYYMENGYIIEQGSHIQLIQAKGKYFSRLEETINLSLESKKKFDSQLKAYKVNQLLQKKKQNAASKEAGGPSDQGAGDGRDDHSPSRPKDKEDHGNFLNGFFKLMHLGSDSHEAVNQGNPKVQPKPNAGETSKPTDSTKDGKTDDNEQFKLLEHQQEKAMTSATLEEAYHRYSDRGSFSTERAMHQGFGLMGFQRMNFARPMTNYSSQAQKQRHSFQNKFTLPGKMAQGKKRKKGLLSSLPEKVLAGRPSHATNIRGRQSIMFGRQSKRLSRAQLAQETDVKEQKEMKSPTPEGDFRRSRPRRETLKMKKKSKTKSFLGYTYNERADRMAEHEVEPDQESQMDRESLVEALKAMTQPQKIGRALTENVEIDDVVLLSHEMDEFFAEYDDAIFATVQTPVHGRWRDIFFVTKHDWPFIIIGILASIILGIATPVQTYILGSFFQVLEKQFPDDNSIREDIMELSSDMVIMGGVTALAAFMQEFCFGMAGRRMTRRLRERIYQHILTQDLSWFDERAHDIGILTFQLYADTTIVHQILLIAYGIAIQALANIGASIFIAFVGTSEHTFTLTLVFIALMPLLVFMVFFSSVRNLKEAMFLDRKFKSSCAFTQEFLQSINTWVTLGAESHFIERHSKLLEKEYKWLTFSSALTSCLHSVVQTSCWLLYGLFVFLTLKYQYPQNVSSALPYSLVGYIMITTELLIFGAFRIGDQIVVLADTEFGKTAAHKIRRILEKEPVTDGSSKIMTIPDMEENTKPPEIILKDVRFNYPQTNNRSTTGSLEGISLTIPSGSYVAIVGPPGSGKSTLCNIILRMCDPSYGIMEMNGEDCFHLSPKVTRRLMSLVEYDPCLFDVSIWENILFGKCHKQVAKAEIEDAAKMSICHFDILDLPDDYLTEINSLEKTAANFSLKQRISYARALVKNPRILIVDDATTSVDTESDLKVLQVIANAREDRTLIVFSHKIEPIRDADLIYVMWGGELVETGNDAKLLTKQGVYYEMYMTQKVLAETMRNSPHQLSTIRYNIKSEPVPESEASKIPRKSSSLAYIKFLDEKVNRAKAEKQQRRTELEKEASELEKEEKERAGRNKRSNSRN